MPSHVDRALQLTARIFLRTHGQVIDYTPSDRNTGASPASVRGIFIRTGEQRGVGDVDVITTEPMLWLERGALSSVKEMDQFEIDGETWEAVTGPERDASFEKIMLKQV